MSIILLGADQFQTQFSRRKRLGTHKLLKFQEEVGDDTLISSAAIIFRKVKIKEDAWVSIHQRKKGGEDTV